MHRTSLLLLLLSLTAAAPACRRADATAPERGAPSPPPATPLVAPERVRHVSTVEALGSLRPRDQAQLAFVLAGTLERIEVRRGQPVAEGATLLALEASGARAQLAQAEAAVAAARAQVVLARDAQTRLEAIRREQGGVTDAQLVQARSQLDLANAQVLAADAQRDQARVTLARHTLRAPFAGVVTRVPDGVGLAVSAGVPLAAIESVRQLVLDTSLTQEEASQVRPGARVEVTVAATGARCTDAVVRAVVPTVDPATNRVPVEIAVPNADGRFLPHASARARIGAGVVHDGYRVPAASVLQKEGGFAVWVAGADGRARALPVRVLHQEADGAIVDPAPGTFAPGVRVVVLPPVGIADGQPLPGAAAR